MRKLFISAVIVAGLVLGGVSTFAKETGMKQTETAKVTQISGKVTDIKGDSFMLKEESGKTHKVIPAEPSELTKIKVGDNVTVDMRAGKAVAINKTDNTGSSETTQGGGSQNQENQN